MSFNSYSFAQPLDEIAYEKEWLALLHYNGERGSSEFASFVDDSDFFISPNGKYDPVAEMQATLNLFKQSSLRSCRFIARYTWLTKQGLIQQEDNVQELSTGLSVKCDEYQKWRDELNTQSVVLVYASNQLNSPSSMYGHSFLRFDPPNTEENSTYLSYALNFGANIPENAGNFSYAVKGLFGGYPGNFAANPYFKKIKEYTRSENRDLWEYKLNLTSQEIDLMLAHVWELKEVNFDYYFFDENCAFRLLELLDIGRPQSQLIAQFPYTAMPIDTVKAVKSTDLVASVHYRPSVLTQLNYQLGQLSPYEQSMVIELANDTNLLNSDRFNVLPEKQQQVMIDSAYRYLRYQNIDQARDSDVSKRSFTLLQYINKTQLESIESAPRPEFRPDQGHDTSMLAAAIGDGEYNTFADFTFKATYHDFLDPLLGYSPGMSLNMGKAVVRVTEDKVKVQKLEVLNIRSLSVRNEFVSPISWQASISMDRLETGEHTDQWLTQASAGGGVSYSLFKQGIIYSLLTIRAEINADLDDAIVVAPGANIGFIYNSSLGNTQINLTHYDFIGDVERTQISLKQSYNFSNQQTIIAGFNRTLIDNYQANEVSIEYRTYF